MKIIFAIKALNSIAGGAERVICVVASELATLGHNVTIVSFDCDDNTPFYPLSNSVKRKHLGRCDPRHKTTPVEVVTRTLALRQYIIEQKPDIVVGFMHSIFIPLSFAMIGTKIPVIASEHIVPQYYKFRRLEFLAMIASSFFTKGITVLSGPVRDLYPKILRKKMIVTPNPVSTFPTPNVSEKNKIILNVARLTEQKDQKTLIDAFAGLAPDFPEWSLRIVGEGELREKLEKQIKSLGLESRISLPGKNAAVENEYARAEVFAIPSHFESFGLATAEALSFKLPAVGFNDCPGTNEIIIDGVNGILMDSKDRVSSLKNALRRLMSSEDYRRQLGNRGPETIEPYQPRTIAKLWENILSQAL